MIDITREKPITLEAAAKLLPGNAAGGTVCYHSIYRWITRGCRGVKLESICAGNKQFTSAEALDRFVRSLTALRDSMVSPLADAYRKQSPRSSRKISETDRERRRRNHGF
jgi:hypothetical protein